MDIRQLVWALIAVLLLYGGWEILRSLTAGRRVRKSAASEDDATRSGDPAQAGEAVAVDDDDAGEDAGDEGDFDYAPLPANPAPAPAVPAVPAPAPDLFAFELELQRLRRELGALRAALDVQQEEIGALHDEVRRLGEAPSSVAPVAAAPLEQYASPEYSEALVLARRGLSVEEISARCGITRAEAELVVSLAARGDGEGAA